MSDAAVAREAPEEHPTSTGLNHRKILMWAFLGSECIFFGSLITTYLVYRGKSVVGPYPSVRFSMCRSPRRVRSCSS